MSEQRGTGGAAGDAARAGGVHEDAEIDRRLVARTLAGDGRAFAELVDRHAPVCLRYATRLLGSREDAEDATQETLMRAYRSLDGYDPARPLRTWLLGILVNRCRTATVQRRRREMRVVADDEAVRRAADDGAAGFPGDGVDDQIARALARLDEAHREAFLLKHVEQLSYEEMAAMTGVGVSALKMRVKRACERLREMMEDDDARA